MIKTEIDYYSLPPEQQKEFKNSPMKPKELEELEICENNIRKAWQEGAKISFELGKQLVEIRDTQNYWKQDEIFKIKRGKNKGEFVKKPSFEKYIKAHPEVFGEESIKLLTAYDRHQINKKYHSEQLEKLIQQEAK